MQLHAACSIACARNHTTPQARPSALRHAHGSAVAAAKSAARRPPPPPLLAQQQQRRHFTSQPEALDAQQQHIPTTDNHHHSQHHQQAAGAAAAAEPPHEYERAAAAAALAAFAAGQQRALLRLPRAAAAAPVAAAVAARAVAGGGRALLLADGAARWGALYAELRSRLPAGSSIGRIPGAPLQIEDAVILVDLQHVAAAPRAAWQLRRHVERLALAVLDEPLAIAVAGSSDGSSGRSGDGSSGDGGGGAVATVDPLQAAEQILRDTGFLEASLDKRLLTISGRFWEALLQPAGGYAVAVAQMQQVAYQMPLEEAVKNGWVSPLRAVTVDTGVTLDESLLAGSVGDVSSSSTSSAAAAGTLEDALCRPARLDAVVASYMRLCPSARAIAHTAGPAHARALAVALSLRGVPAVPLHQQLPAAEQAAVVAAFAGGCDRVLVTSMGVERLPLGALPVEALVMAAPTASRAEYAARLAPGMGRSAAAAAAAGGPGGGGRGGCLVVDIVDQWTDSGSRGSGRSGLPVLICQDVWPLAAAHDQADPEGSHPSDPSDAQQQQPPQDAADGASTKQGGSSKQQQSRRRKAAEEQEAPTSGLLEWVVLDDGSWAIPLSKQRATLNSAMTGAAAAAAAAGGRGGGRGAAGSRVIKLRRIRRSGTYYPEIEVGGVETVPLEAGRRKGLKLQAARVRGFWGLRSLFCFVGVELCLFGFRLLFNFQPMSTASNTATNQLRPTKSQPPYRTWPRAGCSSTTPRPLPSTSWSPTGRTGPCRTPRSRSACATG
jgi:hypothetical protein